MPLNSLSCPGVIFHYMCNIHVHPFDLANKDFAIQCSLLLLFQSPARSGKVTLQMFYHASVAYAKALHVFLTLDCH